MGWLFGAAAQTRVQAFERGWMSSVRPPMPTLSIGNLSAGGTGKTPLLLHAIDWLQRHDAQVGVLSRGYGGDEGRILEERHPAATLIENPNRREGLATLQAQGGAEVLLLDDGFQHLRIQRDLDVVLLDATRPFGRCFPAGFFRERPRALRRAHAIVLSRTELVAPSKVEAIWQEVDQLRAGCRALPRLEGGMVARDLRRLHDGAIESVEVLAERPVRLASGIGNPASFRALVEAQGAIVEADERKGDHHAWSAADCTAWSDDRWVVVTEKDGVKIRPFTPEQVWELRADWRFHRGENDWQEILNRFYLPVRAARIEPLWSAHDPEGRVVE
ncbi:MAG: tetraacyldisaccharide 4'-kinase [Planctomycetes bacterium]|nr:tetraacyldisaccharide 4'-kinase [Planctomycetota bacterium]